MSQKPLRILIVDDDEDILANLSDILSDVGHKTETAPNGLLALEKVEKACPDVCLVDFKMPGMDGVQLIEKIHCTHPDLRTIMITAFAGDDGVERALQAGTWKVLRKPIEIDSLLGLINESVKK